MTKILIIGDQHGNIPKVNFKDFDFVLCPGDFCDDSEIRKYIWKVYSWNIKNRDKPSKYWWDEAGKKKAKKILDRSVQSGRKVLDFLNRLEKPVYVIPGNWDWYGQGGSWKYLSNNFYKKSIKGLKNVKDCDMKIVEVKDFLIVGYGKCSGPEYPQHPEIIKEYSKEKLKKYLKEYKKLSKKLNLLFKKAKKKNKPTIFLSHNVPYNTKLDKITNKESPRYGFHFGSVIARELIKKYKPSLCEAGHMHEHYDKDKIGKTVCINSGFGPNANVLVEIEGNKVKSVKFNKPHGPTRN